MDQIGLHCIGMDRKSFCSRIAWKTFCCNAWKTFWLQYLEDLLLQCFVGDVAGSNAWKTIAPLRNPDVQMRLCIITSITPVGRWTRALDRHVHTSLHTPVLFVRFVLFCFVLFCWLWFVRLFLEMLVLFQIPMLGRQTAKCVSRQLIRQVIRHAIRNVSRQVLRNPFQQEAMIQIACQQVILLIFQWFVGVQKMYNFL